MPTAVPTFRSAAERAIIASREQQRGSASARGYGRQWQAASKAHLRANPICACGCGRAADVVDHRVPHRGDMALFWDRSNWQSMAKACHDAKTAREDTLTGRPAR